MNNYIILILFLVNSVFSNHYRGSMISWRVVNSTSNFAIVEIFQRHTWHYYSVSCNDAQIIAGNKKYWIR